MHSLRYPSRSPCAPVCANKRRHVSAAFCLKIIEAGASRQLEHRRGCNFEESGGSKSLEDRRSWGLEEAERLRSWSIDVREAETREKDRADQIQRVFRSGHQVHHRMVSPRTVRNLDALLVDGLTLPLQMRRIIVRSRLNLPRPN